MKKKLKYIFFEITILIILYVLSIAFDNTVSVLIEKSMTSDSALNSLLKLIEFIWGLLTTGIFEVIIGMILIPITFLCTKE